MRYVAPVKALCEEWYPKINAILYGEGAPLPFPTVEVILEPAIWSGTGQDRTVVPAYTNGNTIHVNSAYLVDIPDDYLAMMIHELTHVNQAYGDQAGAGWLVEGIADYVRHKYYEKDIEPRLHLDVGGKLEGFELDRNHHDFEHKGYMDGYTVTGAFLYWLEVRKDENIVPALNRALREKHYTDAIFQEHCGSPLEALWQEFVAQSRTP